MFISRPYLCLHSWHSLRTNLEYVNPCNSILNFGGSLSSFIFFIRFCLYCRTRKMLREDWINILDKKINITTFGLRWEYLYIVISFDINDLYIACADPDIQKRSGPFVCRSSSTSSLSSYFKGAIQRLNFASFDVILENSVEERRGPDQLDTPPVDPPMHIFQLV